MSQVTINFWEGDAGAILGQEDPLEKEMATHSSVLAWRIPWMEEPGGLPCTGSQRVRYDLATKQQQQTKFDVSLEEGVSTHRDSRHPNCLNKEAANTAKPGGPRGGSIAGSLALDCHPPALRGEKFLWLKPNSPWCLVMATLPTKAEGWTREQWTWFLTMGTVSRIGEGWKEFHVSLCTF